MEREDFIRCILDIFNVIDLPVKVILTDRHTGIKKLMRTDERFQDTLHQFDPWHAGKSLLKKFMKASQKSFPFLLKGLFSSSILTRQF